MSDYYTEKNFELYEDIRKNLTKDNFFREHSLRNCSELKNSPCKSSVNTKKGGC